MKWFKHYSDSYSNLKHQQMIAEFGLEGYGFFWVCVELVAQQGTNARIKADKQWKKVLAHITHSSEEKMEKFLDCYARVNLIDKKGLEIGDLYIPKLRDYSDDYTDRVRRRFGHSSDNVRLDKKRIDKKRIEESGAPSHSNQSFFNEGETYKNLLSKFSEKLNPSVVETEFKKFILYWTEPNKSGSKVRWEQQQTFDVERRLFTWFSRIQERQGNKEKNYVI